MTSSIQCTLLPNAIPLTRSESYSLSFDLHAYFPPNEENNIVIRPRNFEIVRTGLIIHIHPGYEGQIRSYPGLSLLEGLTVLGGVQIIEPFYDKEVSIVLSNQGKRNITITNNKKIAQLKIMITPAFFALVNSSST